MTSHLIQAGIFRRQGLGLIRRAGDLSHSEKSILERVQLSGGDGFLQSVAHRLNESRIQQDLR